MWFCKNKGLGRCVWPSHLTQFRIYDDFSTSYNCSSRENRCCCCSKSANIKIHWLNSNRTTCHIRGKKISKQNAFVCTFYASCKSITIPIQSRRLKSPGTIAATSSHACQSAVPYIGYIETSLRGSLN